jgi:demethylmenaquinone methyltransferase/2-methoxy-6-polyprenyl-1,4-benzoquinol methylase
MPPSAQQPDAKTAWNDQLLANPHTVADKRRRVRDMFAAIAPTYDINNRLHSLWQDQRWRRKAVKLAQVQPTEVVVDVACGTGDLALRFAKVIWSRTVRTNHPIGPRDRQVIGVDFTYEMLSVAKRKTREQLWYSADIHSLGDESDEEKDKHCQIRTLAWLNGDAQSLPLPDASADVVSIAFGIRNVQDPAAAIREFFRILRPGGRVIVLEFSLPTNRLLRGLYNFYFRQVLPRTATLISGDKTGAYKYLPESVNTFIGRTQMVQMLETAGFEKVEQFPMTFGVCVCYRGVKPAAA